MGKQETHLIAFMCDIAVDMERVSGRVCFSPLSLAAYLPRQIDDA